MAFLDDDADTHVSCPSRVKEFPGDVSNLVPISSNLLTHVFCLFSYRLKCNLLLENSSMCLQIVFQSVNGASETIHWYLRRCVVLQLYVEYVSHKNPYRDFSG
jgi:hypothetical protein